jgi:sugar lactone lactonase YvrE
VWPNEGSVISRNISAGLKGPRGLFVTSNGDIYVDNGNNLQVDKWTLNATSGVNVMDVTNSSISLFVDINNTLYASFDLEHKVTKVSLNSGSATPIIAAGNGTFGAGSYMLYAPSGIYVDIKFNLYVADCYNNRIQLFKSGQSNGTTVLGNGSAETIVLNRPSGITFDADGYLFITDCDNNRILGSGPNGYRCIAGCSGAAGNSSYQLNTPRGVNFDTYGNIFVADSINNRIQIFLLATNSCGEYYHSSSKN